MNHQEVTPTAKRNGVEGHWYQEENQIRKQFSAIY